MKNSKLTFTVLLTLLSLVCWSSAGPQATADIDKWTLWQNGPHLRGANIYQRQAHPQADGQDVIDQFGPVIPPYNQEDFNRLATLGANYVNISHPGLFTETPPYTVDPVIQANLDGLLDKIAQANMFAVISFRTGPGRNEFTFLDEEDPGWVGQSLDIHTLWTDQAAQDGWVAMWRYTAERYRHNPIVVGYDLLVEPNGNILVGVDGIYDPADFYPAHANSLYDWNQLHPRLSAAIREVDPDTPILTGSMSFSALAWLPYLKTTGDTRTIYTVHQYEPFQYTHQDPPQLDLTYPGNFDIDGDGTVDGFNQTWLDNFLGTIDTFKATHNVPVAVNEFGLKRWQPGAAQFMADEMALFEQRGLNHALWLWETSTEPFVQYSHDFNLLFGPDPDNREEVATSDLLEVVKQNWALNRLHPANSRIIFLPIITVDP